MSRLSRISLFVLGLAVLGMPVTVAAQSCTQNATTLCLNSNRFAVSATWRTANGQTGQGQAVRLTSDTGYFTFFSASNVEVIVKVLNACSVNSRYWVFAGGLSDVNVVMTVRDTVRGTTKTYTNPQGTAFRPIQDTDAFASCSGSAGGLPTEIDGDAARFDEPVAVEREALPDGISTLASCTPSGTTICLNDDRFAVSATWSTPNGQSGQAQAVRLTTDTGYFTFFGAANVEVVVKVLNACGVNSRQWVFAGGLTNVQFVLTVRDTVTGTTKTYTNPQGAVFQPVLDSGAFSLCGGGTEFRTGTTTVVANQSVAPAGGTITVTGSGTAIEGAKIVFPTGALSSTSNVRVSFNRGTISPVSGTFSSAALVIDAPGASSFNQPVTITVPYGGGNNAVPVPYFADAAGKLRPAQILSINRQAGTFTFQTFHASIFTWIYALLTPSTPAVSTVYAPANDGFQVVNTGSTYNRDGECFGMTAFSLWYLLNGKASKGKFYPKYMAVVGTDADGNSIRGQNVIATRAFTSITQKWTSYLPEVRRQQSLTPAERFASIQNIIANTDAPVLIYLYHATGTATGAHSVLAYAVDTANRRISIYDPNKPGTTQTIQYSTTTNDFTPYCNGACYDGIIYNGDGSLNVTEPYSNILADAETNFSNSGGATITITSHTSGQVLSSRLATLAGNVRSGQLLISKLTVVVGSTEQTVDVPLSGNFSIPLALSDGVNHLKFKTEGKNASGVLTTSSNNYDIKDFTLRAVVPASVVLMTLTWDKNDTDVDTYVIDPTGDYSAYYHKRTADGGVLDQDITRGFGPEHWTLLNTNTVRYNQPYKFRVHYYSDHGNGPTNYLVTIELYNGTSRQVTHTFTGALAASSPFNDRPDDVGPDWRDIATVVLTQNNVATPSIETGTDGRVTITVPVPAAEERTKEKP